MCSIVVFFVYFWTHLLRRGKAMAAELVLQSGMVDGHSPSEHRRLLRRLRCGRRHHPSREAPRSSILEGGPSAHHCSKAFGCIVAAALEADDAKSGWIRPR
jgi:hypothetical protein